MKLRTKFAIAIMLVMLVLSSVVLGSIELFKQQTVADEQRSLDETANLTARQIESTAETRREEIRLFASSDITDPSATGRYLPRFVNQTQFFAAQTVAPNGTIVDFRGGIPREQREGAIGKYVGNRTHVRAALEGTVAVSEPERVEGTSVTILRIAAPIYDESPNNIETASEADGALVGAIYLDFSNFFTTARTVRTSEQTVAVYDRVDGERLVLLQPEQSFERNLTATQTFGLSGWEWTIRVTRDRSGLENRLDNLALIQGLSMALVLGSLVLLGVWEYRTTLRQTEKLLDGFVAIQKGEYEYSLSLTAADEWVRISDGFADLSRGLATRESALREREQRLDVLNRVLRHNVRNEMSIIHNYADIISDFTDDSQIESAAGTILEAGGQLTDLSDRARQIRSAFEEADRWYGFDTVSLVTEVVSEMSDEFPETRLSQDVPDGITVVGLPALDLALENVVENACEHNDAEEPVVDINVEFDPTTQPQRTAPATLELDTTGTAGSPAADEGKSVDEDDGPADETGTAEEAEQSRSEPLAPESVGPGETVGMVYIRVTDNGPGIPEHEYSVLTAGEETALEHGSGLGLWLIFWVVNKSGGELIFEDADPRGSTVTMVLPARGPTPTGDAQL